MTADITTIKTEIDFLLCEAVHRDCYDAVSLLLDFITEPHDFGCLCSVCSVDRLGQSKRRIEHLKALSNPVWIGLTSTDPFLTAFKIYKKCKTLGRQEDCFEKTYHQLKDDCQRFCCQLLDQLESENEVICLMKYDEIRVKENGHLSFIKLAIEYEQKEVVAHPIPQHVISSLVFDNVPGWRTSGLLYRICYIFLVACLFPLTSIMHVIAPCSVFGEFVKNPLVKFVNGAASFVTLLVLLAVIATSEKAGIRTGETPTPIEATLFVWTISLLVHEFKQLIYQGKQEYFSIGWNWIDISMITLMLCSYFMWTIMYFRNPSHKDESFKFFVSFADGFYALAIVLSFFRMVYLCQITRFLGLLQLCLGRMLQVIFQFAFISCVVLWSFSVGMVFLFHSSGKYEEIVRLADLKNQNQSAVHEMLSGGYNGLPATMVTLAWASMNMANLDSLEGLNDGTMIHLWSYFLFTLYHGVSMIVLLNMLIAMMSNSYQQIENNIEVEHKYARTNLWLEYISGGNTLPCPFNLIPSHDALKKACRFFKSLHRRRSGKCKELENTSRVKSREEYTKLCKTLISRYFSQVKGVYFDDKDIPTNSPSNEKFVTKLKSKLKAWSNLLQTSIPQDIIPGAEDGHYNPFFSENDSSTEMNGQKTRKENIEVCRL
ncbi:short transient receptor potential channel 4-like isoform X2 [Hydractinia symbiolongicarpus]|uniref:short transient receptor potential channel 4-like isoform X2 n=1 Tax=Hydractinia symbiolongicarpus TaxID=13093 RepID=UPI00254CD13F|nr:short transient receptor potential channel 4-like isoform X2 [Hydractinia symbiolongicarpus]